MSVNCLNPGLTCISLPRVVAIRERIGGCTLLDLIHVAHGTFTVCCCNPLVEPAEIPPRGVGHFPVHGHAVQLAPKAQHLGVSPIKLKSPTPAFPAPLRLFVFPWRHGKEGAGTVAIDETNEAINRDVHIVRILDSKRVPLIRVEPIRKPRNRWW